MILQDFNIQESIIFEKVYKQYVREQNIPL